MFWPFRKKCKHTWGTLVDKFVESNVERLVNHTNPNDGVDRVKTHFRYLPSDLSGTNIVILQCTECGKIDKTITRT